VSVLRNAGDGSAGFTLASGAKQQNLVRRQVAELFLVQKFAAVAQVAAGAGGFNGVAHGAAGDHHFAARGARSTHGGGNAVHMRSKSCDGNALPGMAHNVDQRFSHIGLGR
jgi:hypothetical protein